MNYLSLDEYKKAWVFRHKDLPIDSTDLEKIKPMSQSRAANVWMSQISKNNDHPDFFVSSDWPAKNETWCDSIDWEKAWENDQEQLPEELMAHLDWDNNTVIYFCNSRMDIIETRWNIFKRYWKNFLFMSDGSLLIGKKRDEVVQFMETGQAKLGTKPKS